MNYLAYLVFIYIFLCRREGGQLVPDGSGRHKENKPSLLRALWKSFGTYYMTGGLMLLIECMLQLANPQILK